LDAAHRTLQEDMDALHRSLQDKQLECVALAEVRLLVCA